jgi:hypothetical protein
MARTARGAAPVSAGEINRELTVLKRMFILAVQTGKLHHKPRIPMLHEVTGWRINSEVLRI